MTEQTQLDFIQDHSAITDNIIKRMLIEQGKNLTEEQLRSLRDTLELTLSKYNTEEEIDYVIAEFPAIVKRLRMMSPLYDHFKTTGERMKAGPGTDYDHHHHHGSQPSGHWERGYHQPQGTPPAPLPQYRDRGF